MSRSGSEEMCIARAHLVGIDIQADALGCEDGVGDEHRVVGHVGAAQVQQPGNLVQSRYQDSIQLACMSLVCER